jgi:hypothetical protein
VNRHGAVLLTGVPVAAGGRHAVAIVTLGPARVERLWFGSADQRTVAAESCPAAVTRPSRQWCGARGRTPKEVPPCQPPPAGPRPRPAWTASRSDARSARRRCSCSAARCQRRARADLRLRRGGDRPRRGDRQVPPHGTPTSASRRLRAERAPSPERAGCRSPANTTARTAPDIDGAVVPSCVDEFELPAQLEAERRAGPTTRSSDSDRPCLSELNTERPATVPAGTRTPRPGYPPPPGISAPACHSRSRPAQRGHEPPR